MHEDAHERRVKTAVALHESRGSKTLSVIKGEIFTLANGLETQLQPSPRLQPSISIETQGSFANHVPSNDFLCKQKHEHLQ